MTTNNSNDAGEVIQCPHCNKPIRLSVIEGRETLTAEKVNPDPPPVDPPPKPSGKGSVLSFLRKGSNSD